MSMIDGLVQNYVFEEGEFLMCWFESYFVEQIFKFQSAISSEEVGEKF